MRVLVTGGTGFVGSHTAAALVNSGHEVRLLAREPDAVDSTPRVGDYVGHANAGAWSPGVTGGGLVAGGAAVAPGAWPADAPLFVPSGDSCVLVTVTPWMRVLTPGGAQTASVHCPPAMGWPARYRMEYRPASVVAARHSPGGSSRSESKTRGATRSAGHVGLSGASELEVSTATATDEGEGTEKLSERVSVSLQSTVRCAGLSVTAMTRQSFARIASGAYESSTTPRACSPLVGRVTKSSASSRRPRRMPCSSSTRRQARGSSGDAR